MDELYSVNTKPFKRTYLVIQLLSAAAIIGSYFLGSSGLFFVPAIGFSRLITFPALLLMFIVTLVHNRTLRKRIDALGSIEDFEIRVQVYERVYRHRMQWNMITCLIICLLFILSGRYFFLYFSIFQVVLYLPFYPNPLLFRRELKNEEIILY